MRSTAYQDWRNNPFHLKSEREMELDLFSHLQSQGVQPEAYVLSDEDKHLPSLPGGEWDYVSASRIRRQRYALAVLGSVILVVPMLVMTFVPGRTASIATVVVCTMFFAVATAYFAPAKPPLELMAATAAYAAVLVVFVGGQSGGQSGGT